MAGLFLIVKAPGPIQRTFTTGFTVTFMLLKVATGLLYTWVMLRYIPSATADIDLFFGDGLAMYRSFWQNPAGFPAYLSQLFTITDFNLTQTDSDFIRTVFEGIKFIHFFLNFFSGGHLFTNVLLFNLLSGFLFLRCWAWMQHKWQSFWPGFWFFAFPSAFFFTSVILKEGIEWSLIAVILPALDAFMSKRRIWQLPGLIILFGLLFFFKYLIALTFCGCLFLYLLYCCFPGYKFRITVAFISLSAFLFFNASYLHPALNFPNAIIERRLEFAELEANSALTMRTLTPDGLSFLKALPEALRNVLLRPLPGEEGKVFYLAFFVEMLLFWGILGILLVRIFKSKSFRPGAFELAAGLFCLANILIIGYTITNTGAIIRYRSIFLPGLIFCLWQYAPKWLFYRFESYALK